jgi:hypothetical protein
MWLLMALLVLGALAGVFGSGPISRSRAEAPGGGLIVEYERFLRYQSHTSLLMTLRREQAGDRIVELVVDRSLLKNFKVERTTPQADRIEYGRGGVTYAFPVAAEEQEVVVRFELQPEALGTQVTALSRGTGGAVYLRQFVWF